MHPGMSSSSRQKRPAEECAGALCLGPTDTQMDVEKAEDHESDLEAEIATLANASAPQWFVEGHRLQSGKLSRQKGRITTIEAKFTALDAHVGSLGEQFSDLKKEVDKIKCEAARSSQHSEESA
eukprot:1661226-Karenia_brevis.AAC.1